MSTDDSDRPDDVLGRIAPGERDTRLGGPEGPRPAGSHRRYGPAAGEPTPAREPEDAPTLPRGGLVVMRVSGGYRFSSREVVVYRDGRVLQRRHVDGLSIYRGGAQRLMDDQLAELRQAIDQLEIARSAEARPRQSPDTLAYEIVARAGRRLKRAEAFTGGIPESLAPLIRLLSGLLPPAE